MKKIYKLSALWMMCLALLGSVSFTACNEGDDVDTNQYVKGINLNVFGPSPVARGGVLRFLGSGLDQVTAVAIPGCADITDIDVISENEIRVEVPQTAEPGLVTLRTPKGDITTKTGLTYSEPISLDAVAPNPVKPGATLTLTGEYLNLIKEVIFADNVTVEAAAFAAQNRKEIKVVVPVEAQTGKIIISDGAEIPNWIYSATELKVTLPAVAEVADYTDVKPGDVLTFEGTDFDLITKVAMPNGDAVEYAIEENKLSFTLPENVSDGAVVVIPASGVEVTFANIVVAVPTEVVATPAAELRAGDVITLTGKNMELVTDVTFPGVADAVAPSEQSETVLKVAMPEGTVSGELLLNTASGAAIPVAIVTQKPEFESFASDAVALAGQVVIKGKNMDLVAKVTFTGGAEVTTFTATSAELTLTMPSMQVETGVLTLTMANGESVETASLTINAPEACYIPELPGEDVELKGGEVWVVEVANGDKLVGVQIDGKDVDFLLNGNTLYISVPQMANANSVVKLISSNGELEYAVAFIPATEIKNTVWSGMVDITWGDGGRVIIPASAFEGVPAGAKMVLHYQQKQDIWSQAQINYGDWSGINFTEGDFTFSQTLVPTDHYGWAFDARQTPLTLTQEILDNIQAKKASGDDDFAGAGVIIQGSDLIFTAVTLEWEVSLEQNIANCLVWQGDQSTTITLPMQITWDDSGRFRVLRDAEPAIQDMKLVAGKSVMYFYVSGTGQLQINDANWSSFTTVAEWNDAGDKQLALVLTQDMVDWLKGDKSDGWSSTAMIIQGDGFTLSKVTILP